MRTPQPGDLEEARDAAAAAPGAAMGLPRAGLVLAVVAIATAIGVQAALHSAIPWREYTIATLIVGLIGLVGATVWAARLGLTAEVASAADAVAAGLARGGWRAYALLAGALWLTLSFVALVVLQAFPNSGDEYAFVMQADTYRAGRFSTPTPPAYESFMQFRYLAKGEAWFSPYQGGWSAVMTAFATLGVPYWMVNPVLGAAAALAFFALARLYVSAAAAALATLALITSAFFLLNYASFFGHGIAALSAIGFAFFGRRFLERGDWRDAALAGACVGMLGFGRAFNAVAIAAPFAVALLLSPKRWRAGIAFGVGGAPFVALLAWFNAGVSGLPHVVPGSWYSSSEPLGAPSGLTIMNTVNRFVTLQVWTSPLLTPAYALALVWLARARKLDFTDWIFPVTVAAFLFYGGDGGNQYGPRYYFEAWPFLLLSVFKAFDALALRAPASRLAPWLAAALIAHIGFQIGYVAPRLAREHRIIVERQDVYRQAAAQGLRDAIVFISGYVGVAREMHPRDLVRNGPFIGEESVIYARDLGPEKNAAALRAYPGRAGYLYRCGALMPLALAPPYALDPPCPNTAPDPVWD
ncbi:MAG: hypothetical protein NW203_14005 [Hyphomonadaceae bacterium]|nr:hypothetical protein [Hyphomonadaceae bacterium]